MLELQALVLLLDLAQLLQLGFDFRIQLCTLGHDLSLADLFAPTRQHEWVYVKRGCVALNLSLYRYVVLGPGFGTSTLLNSQFRVSTKPKEASRPLHAPS